MTEKQTHNNTPTPTKTLKQVPKLRFSEFEEEWLFTNLGYVAKIYDGTHQTPKYVDSGVPFVSVENINDIENTGKYITLTDFEKDFKIKPKKGDILMTRITAGVIGATSIITNDSPLGYYVSLALIRNNYENKIDTFFLEKYINSIRFKKELHKRIIHIAFPKKINLGEINNCVIAYSTLKEQEKIASFLSSVDKKIAQLQKKQSLLEQYKKGVMQQIFPSASSGQAPKLRFKDDEGNDYPDWEEKKLGKIGKTLNGLTGKTKDDFGLGKPYIQYKQIFDSSKINIEDCGLVNLSETENQTKVQFGDSFFTTSSETANEIGTTSVLLDEVDEMYLNSFCFGLRISDEILNPSFSQFLFRSAGFRRKMIPLAQGSTRYNISKGSFLKLNILIPCIDEQTKIAHFLSAIDKKIELVSTQIENTQQFKKGLLQQMFV